MKLLIGDPAKQAKSRDWIPRPIVNFPENSFELFHDSKLPPKTFLYNLTSDPNETENLAQHHPDIVKDLMGRLSKYFKTMITPDSTQDIEAGNPKHNDGIWPVGWCQSRPENNTATTATATSSTTVPTG